MTRIFTFFLLVANTLFFYSQSTGITYQALIINPQGENVPGVNNTSAPLANKDICMRFSIYDNNNQAEYVETIKTTTDKSGIVNLIIGSGSKVGGYASSFSAIVWDKNLKRLKVEFDVTANCSSYLEISNQTFSYVPFTYYSSSTKEATSTTTGSIKLAGDLAGTGSTAQSPKITDGAITSNKIANGAIVNSKIGELISVTNGGTGNSNIVGYVVGNGINPMTGVTSIPVSDINGAQTIANLEANITSSTDPQNKYPSVKAVKDYITGSLAVATIPDADTTTKGKVQLAGDLAGTAAAPTVPGLALKANTTALTTEINRATAAEGTLTSGLAAEVTRATGAEATLTTNVATNATAITAEKTRATAAEGTLTSDLAAEVTRATAAEGTLTTDLAAANTAIALKEDAANKSTATTLGTSDVLFPTQKAVKTYVDTSIASATIADADATTKGKLQLAGDLTGTAASPAIAASAVTTSKIAASAITTAKIADDAVTSAKIKDGEIVNADVSSTAAIAYSKLSLSNSIVTSDIADGAITTDKIASSAVTTGKLADNAVNAYKIDDDAVVTSKIKDGAVTDAKLASGISASKVGLGNVDNTSDANKPVSTAQQTALNLKENLSNKSTDIATDAASNTKYPSVKAIKNYVDSSISSATIADADATTKGKLQLAGDLTGTAASPAIASSAVTSAKILDGTIAVADIADDAIETAKIKNANVTTAKLADASVTNAKLAEAISVANGGTGITTLSAGKIPFGNGTSAFGSSSNLFWDNTNSRLGINTSTPSATFQIGTDCSSCADNLKYFVNNSYNTLKLGFRSSGWHMRTSNNSGVATDLLFSYQDGNNAISDIMTISTLGTVNIPGTLEVTGTSKADTGTFSNLNIGTNNDINYSSTTGKFGIFGTPSAPFQIYGDGGFEYPLKYTSDGQSGGTLGFGFRNKQFKINTTSDSGVLNNMIYSYDDGNSNNTEIMRLTYDGKLSITGGLIINSNAGQGKILTSDANGNASWEDVSATNLASAVTGTLPLANGGTGATTASAAKTNLALENVDNTSDADKPVSTAQQTALNLKENLSNKSTDVATDAASNTKYPSVKAIKNYVDTQVAGATIADADATTKGKLQLAGDLTGTAASPTIAASAVTTSKVAASAITTAKIADDAVTSAKILDGTIANADISSTAAIAYSKLNLTGSIATADLADSAVTTAKINDGAITSAKLSDGSIATGDLADGAVTTAKITDANITYAKIQNVSATDKVLGRVSTGAGTIEEISTTGSGSVVRATSPTLVTPVIGAATGTSLSVSGQLTSTVATGTAPLVVTSTTPVANLSIGGNAATATSASTATNIAGGAAGSLPYQTAAGTTSLLAKGTDGQILTLASGVPSWAAAPTSGVTTMAAIGSTPNANGASISSSTLTLQPANATNGGVVTTAAQTFAGAKTFSSDLTVNGMTVGLGGGSAGSASDTSGASTNVAIGVNTLRLNAGTFQTAIGSDALKSSGSYGLGTVAVGSGAFRSLNNASGSQDRNTAVGTGAYYQLATGQYNVGLGEAVLFSATSGSDNVALGRHAGFGSSTGAAVTSANQSVLIGSDASPFATTTTNEIAIGYAAKGAGDNTTTIGNSSTTKSIIFGSTSLSNLPTTAASGAAGGNFTLTAQNANGTNTKGGDIILTPGTATGTGAAGIVQVNGQVKITGGTPGAGKVLTSDANGVATWSNNTGGGVLSKSASYTILTTDSANYVVFSGATASQTITLPSAVTVGAGREITIKNVASVSLTINASAGYLISDSTTTTATSLAVGIEPSNNWIKAISDGTNWIILRALF